MSVVERSRRAVGQVVLGGWPAGTRVWWLATVSLVLAFTALSSRSLPGDAFYDLSGGQYVVHHGFPHSNVFTWVAHGAGWMDQQWLAQVAYYGAWCAGGYPALAALSALLVAGGFAFLALVMTRRGVPGPRMFAWTLAALLACGNTLVRAQSFGYLLFGLTLWLLAEDHRAHQTPAPEAQADRSQRARLAPRPGTWLVVPVLILWANTHGSVLLGAGLTGLYAAYRAITTLARPDRRATASWLALGAAAGASITATPYGAAIITGYYTHLIGNPVVARNDGEWAPSNPLNAASWTFFALLVVVAVAVVFAWRRGARPDPMLVVLAVILLGLAATGIRFQAWFGFAGALLAADTLARASNGKAPAFAPAFTRSLTGVLAGLAIASLAVLVLAPTATFENFIPARAINAAAAIAAQHPSTHILVDGIAGSPMLWLHPATTGRVGYDVRMEQYTRAQLTALFNFVYLRGPHWQRVTREFGIIVVSRAAEPWLTRPLERLPGWRVAFRDTAGLVMVRNQLRAGTP